jgi:hypothetical protein
MAHRLRGEPYISTKSAVPARIVRGKFPVVKPTVSTKSPSVRWPMHFTLRPGEEVISPIELRRDSLFTIALEGTYQYREYSASDRYYYVADVRFHSGTLYHSDKPHPHFTRPYQGVWIDGAPLTETPVECRPGLHRYVWLYKATGLALSVMVNFPKPEVHILLSGGLTVTIDPLIKVDRPEPPPLQASTYDMPRHGLFLTTPGDPRVRCCRAARHPTPYPLAVVIFWLNNRPYCRRCAEELTG